MRLFSSLHPQLSVIPLGEMARRTNENVLAEMLEKMLAYNISQIIRVRKKLLELQEMQRAAA
jgi:hypothetical protein